MPADEAGVGAKLNYGHLHLTGYEIILTLNEPVELLERLVAGARGLHDTPSSSQAGGELVVVRGRVNPPDPPATSPHRLGIAVLPPTQGSRLGRMGRIRSRLSDSADGCAAKPEGNCESNDGELALDVLQGRSFRRSCAAVTHNNKSMKHSDRSQAHAF